MTLAHVISECEDKLICDFAETYHIFNYRELPLSAVVTLLLGLRDNSRIKMYYSKSKLSIEQTILALIADSVQFLAWTKTKDAKHGRYTQKSVLKLLNGDYDTGNDNLESFESIEDFNEYMSQFLGD